ncbi:MAG: molybdate ABC transporter permease subunit [Archangiaceae bacterium]|nr:molybdate ABC transporter permease subunit [Archangiaceae bacterium]
MNFEPLALSFQVALLAALVAGVVGVGVGGVMARTRFVGSGLLDALFTAPMVLPPTVLGYYLLVALGRQSVIGQAYEQLFGSPIVFTRVGAVVAASVAAFPFVVKNARAALEAVDVRLIGAARTLGASPARVFFTVELPLSVGGIASGVTLGFARALGDFGVTLMVAGNIPGLTRTASLAIYDAVEGGRDADAAGLAAVMVALAVGLLWSVNRLTRPRRHGF